MFTDLVNQIIQANHIKKHGRKRPRSYPRRIEKENDRTHAAVNGFHFLHVNKCTPAEMRRIGIQHRQIKKVLRGRPWESSEQMLMAVFYRTGKYNEDKYLFLRDSFYDSDVIYSVEQI